VGSIICPDQRGQFIGKAFAMKATKGEIKSFAKNTGTSMRKAAAQMARARETSEKAIHAAEVAAEAKAASSKEAMSRDSEKGK